MFNRYCRDGDSYVNIRQQPNDAADAARLYGECKEKAEKEVADAIIIKFGARNELTGVAIKSHRTFYDNKQHIRLLFSINGENFDIHVENTYEDLTLKGYQEITAKLFDQVVQKLISPAMTEGIRATRK